MANCEQWPGAALLFGLKPLFTYNENSASGNTAGALEKNDILHAILGGVIGVMVLGIGALSPSLCLDPYFHHALYGGHCLHGGSERFCLAAGDYCHCSWDRVCVRIITIMGGGGEGVIDDGEFPYILHCFLSQIPKDWFTRRYLKI